MKSADDGQPIIGPSARKLGVRVGGTVVDLPVTSDGFVEPGTGGMSVAVDDAHHLPKHRRPRSLGGEGRDPVFALEAAILLPHLTLRVDRHPHALVEPSLPCPLSEYDATLAGTRPSWRKTHD